MIVNAGPVVVALLVEAAVVLLHVAVGTTPLERTIAGIATMIVIAETVIVPAAQTIGKTYHKFSFLIRRAYVPI